MGLKDVKNIDYKQKENQTFENWFWFCISNLWIPIVLIGAILLTLQIVYFETVFGWVKETFIEEGVFTGMFVCLFMPIPLLIFSITAYKGCYKHWKYVCGDNSYAE